MVLENVEYPDRMSSVDCMTYVGFTPGVNAGILALRSDSTASKTVEDGEPDETWPASTTETDENDRGGGEGVVDGEVSTSTGNDAFVSEDCDVEKSMKVRLQEAIAALQRVEEGF
jgi:outer membrane usher protein FimD/PapC